MSNWEQVHSSIWLFLSLPGIWDLSKCPGRSCVNYGSSRASLESGIIIIIRGTRPYTRFLPFLSSLSSLTWLETDGWTDFLVSWFVRLIVRVETNDRTEDSRKHTRVRYYSASAVSFPSPPRGHVDGARHSHQVAPIAQRKEINVVNCNLFSFQKSRSSSSSSSYVVAIIVVFVDSRPTATHDTMDRWSIPERSISPLS